MNTKVAWKRLLVYANNFIIFFSTKISFATPPPSQCITAWLSSSNSVKENYLDFEFNSRRPWTFLKFSEKQQVIILVVNFANTPKRHIDDNRWYTICSFVPCNPWLAMTIFFFKWSKLKDKEYGSNI